MSRPLIVPCLPTAVARRVARGPAAPTPPLLSRRPGRPGYMPGGDDTGFGRGSIEVPYAGRVARRVVGASGRLGGVGGALGGRWVTWGAGSTAAAAVSRRRASVSHFRGHRAARTVQDYAGARFSCPRGTSPSLGGALGGRWVEYVPGNISRLPLRKPAPGSPAVPCGLPVRGATTRGALGGLAVAVEGAGSPNAPTQRALGRENCPLGPRSGAGSPPSRSPFPFPSSPLLSLPPLFSPSLPRRRHGRYAAGKKNLRGAGSYVGRWVHVTGHPTGAGWGAGSSPCGGALGGCWVRLQSVGGCGYSCEGRRVPYRLGSKSPRPVLRTVGGGDSEVRAREGPSAAAGCPVAAGRGRGGRR